MNIPGRSFFNIELNLFRYSSRKWYFLFSAFCFFLSSISYGQNSVEGIVSDEGGNSLQGAHVHIVELDKSTISNDSGFFKFHNIPNGRYVLKISFIGFKTAVKAIVTNGTTITDLSISLVPKQNELGEILLSTVSLSRKIANTPLPVSLIDVRNFHQRSINTADLLNTAPGVQVRQSGGVGNAVDVSLQGLSGRQVRFFVDGIPMDYLLSTEELGLGPSLAMLPVNLMERIEIYKGAVPVSLSADALGGAINFVKQKLEDDYVEASVGYSSFNTWNTTLNAGTRISKSINAGITAQYTHSDNSYKLKDVNIINENGNPESITTRKFHDHFTSYLLGGHVSFYKIPLLDQITFNTSLAGLEDEIQHNFEMRQPYGEALNKVRTFNNSLRFEKKNVIDKFDAKAYLGYNDIRTQFIDTTLNIYNWRGEIVGRRNFGGEISTSGNDLSLKAGNATGQLQLNYKPGKSTLWTFNTITSYYHRTGTDPVAENYYGTNFYERPINLWKTVTGIGLEKKFSKLNLTSLSALKYFYYQSDGFEIIDNEAETFFLDQNNVGVSQSFSWSGIKDFIPKLSYEYTTRLPDRLEALGDFSRAIASNPSLRPETSHNLNLGLEVKRAFGTISLNGFFKEVKDIIILQAVPPPVLSTYENLLKARVMGVETQINWNPYKWLNLNLSATYQDLRNRSKKENAGVSSDRYFGARLPNRPYFFANSEFQFFKQHLISTNDQLQIWYGTQFVEEFFRYWEIDGRKEDKLSIPRQWLHQTGISYTESSQSYSLSFEVQNIYNQQAYDNFGVQKPGRSFHIKVNASIF